MDQYQKLEETLQALLRTLYVQPVRLSGRTLRPEALKACHRHKAAWLADSSAAVAGQKAVGLCGWLWTVHGMRRSCPQVLE